MKFEFLKIVKRNYEKTTVNRNKNGDSEIVVSISKKCFYAPLQINSFILSLYNKLAALVSEEKALTYLLVGLMNH